MHERQVRAFATALNIRLSLQISATGWVMGNCPFAPWLHARGTDNSPSFGIKVSDKRDTFNRSAYKCLSCGSSGSLPSLAYLLGNYRKKNDPDDDFDYIAFGRKIEKDEIFGRETIILPEWDEKDHEKKKIKNEAQHFWGNPRAEEVFERDFPRCVWHPYLSQTRNIVWNVAIALNLRYDPRECRIVFPIYDKSGRLVGACGRAVSNDTRPRVRDYLGFRKRDYIYRGLIDRVYTRINGSISLIGAIAPCTYGVIVVEGPLDLARLVSLGFRNVVSLLGAVATGDKITALLELDCPIYWMLDDDEAGIAALYGRRQPDGSRDASTGLLDYFYKEVPQFICSYPKGINDPGNLKSFSQAKKMLETAEMYVKR